MNFRGTIQCRQEGAREEVSRVFVTAGSFESRQGWLGEYQLGDFNSFVRGC